MRFRHEGLELEVDDLKHALTAMAPGQEEEVFDQLQNAGRAFLLKEGASRMKAANWAMDNAKITVRIAKHKRVSAPNSSRFYEEKLLCCGFSFFCRVQSDAQVAHGAMSGASIVEYPHQRRTKGDYCMCGIVGYTGTQQAKGILIDGLQHLEYRGYDSAASLYQWQRNRGRAQAGQGCRTGRSAGCG